MMKNKFISIIVPVSIAILASLLFTANADASYDGGNLIDDSTLLNSTTMSSVDIQYFLANMGSGLASRTFYFDCAATDASEQYYRNAGAPCEQTVLASQIIYYASQIYGINPRAVLATLQKEQSLVTTNNPTDWQINQAMGYGCPTTGGCSASNFLYQIDNGVWVLRLNTERARGNMTWWFTSTKWVCGYEHAYPSHFYTPSLYPSQNVNFFDEDNTFYRTHFIANAATSALYCYTPHAYNNPNGLYGLPAYGSTGRYYSGSYNFVYYFEKWFGSTNQPASYKYSITSKDIYSDYEYKNKLSSNSIEPNSDYYVKVVIKNDGNQTWDNRTLHLGTASPMDRASAFSTVEWLGANRPPSMTESYVSAGGNATFTFKIHTPAALGEYSESFGVLIEGQRWLEGTFTIPVTVASSSPYYSAQTTSFEIYSDEALSKIISPAIITKYTNSKIYIKAIVKNTGNQILPANSTRLSASNPIDRVSVFSDSSWMNSSRVTTAQEGNILPQNSGTFVFSITTPSTALTTTREQFGLLIEDVQWIDYNIGSVSIQTIKKPPSSLGVNQYLNINESLLSSDEKYLFILQGDGNLVLYSQGRPIWASWTVGRGASRLVMQADGNLVLYGNNMTPLWYSNTCNRGPSSLHLQPDGNLVLYNSASYTWASWTVGR